MIRITDIKEVRQLEDGSWKFAGYTPDDCIGELLTEKKRSKTNGDDLAIIYPNRVEFDDPTLESLDDIVSKINILTEQIRKRNWHEAGVDKPDDLLTEIEKETINE